VHSYSTVSIPITDYICIYSLQNASFSWYLHIRGRNVIYQTIWVINFMKGVMINWYKTWRCLKAPNRLYTWFVTSFIMKYYLGFWLLFIINPLKRLNFYYCCQLKTFLEQNIYFIFCFVLVYLTEVMLMAFLSFILES
jgi:hypothetical protein